MFQHWLSWGLERRYLIYWITLVATGLLTLIAHYIFILTGGRLFFGIYEKGRENLLHLRKGELILAPNHESPLDPFIALAVIPLRSRVLPLRTLSAPWLFKYAWVRAGLWFLGAIPAHKEGFGSLAEKLDEPVHILKDGHVVVGYAEGGAFEDEEKLHPIRPGIPYLAWRTHAPIIPIAIRGAFRLAPNWIDGWKNVLFGRRVITVNFGKPFYPTVSPDTKQVLSCLDGVERDCDFLLDSPHSIEEIKTKLETTYAKTHELRNRILSDVTSELWQKLHQLYHDPVMTPKHQNPIDYHTCRCIKNTPQL